MRVLYAGGTICDFKTLKRLILIADEIAFIDRPAVTFMSPNWGTIGADSEFRKFDTSGSPIRFSVHAPPSGLAYQLYQGYLEADLKNPNFIKTFIKGLSSDPKFQSRFINPKAHYGTASGQEIVTALLKDEKLIEESFAEPPIVRGPDGPLLFTVHTSIGCRETLKVLLIEASILVTSALAVSETGLIPVSDDPYFCQLLALRTGDSHYCGQTPRLSPYLGLVIAEAVIPDEALDHLLITDLFEYRQSANDTYAAWSTEVDRLASRIAGKKVATWQMPALSLAYLTNLDVISAIVAFAGACMPAFPTLVDYYTKRTSINRANAMAYLIGLVSTKE